MSPAWRFWIDRGGTFTDCIGVSPAGVFHVAKLHSSDGAPLEAIRQILANAGEADLSLDEARVRIKLGTTVATNALLERRGVPTALLTNVGLSGVFEIGTQERPELFDLEIERPPRLPKWWIEVPGRRDAEGCTPQSSPWIQIPATPPGNRRRPSAVPLRNTSAPSILLGPPTGFSDWPSEFHNGDRTSSPLAERPRAS